VFLTLPTRALIGRFELRHTGRRFAEPKRPDLGLEDCSPSETIAASSTTRSTTITVVSRHAPGHSSPATSHADWLRTCGWRFGSGTYNRSSCLRQREF
jgi:hypothetical protein